MTDLSIIIVNWNQRDLLAQCLTSIYAKSQNLRFEVFVVDNGSQDASPRLVQEKFPQAKLIETGSNLGFGKANNIAFGQARGEYVLLMNNDAVLPSVPATLAPLVAYLKAHPEIDIAGPKILSPDGRAEPSCGQINLHTQFSWEIAPFYRPLFHFFWRLAYLLSDRDKQVEAVTGAFLITKRKVLEDIGGFDEAYFLYCEEIDWCKRAAQKGYRVYYLPRFTVVHARTASGQGENFPAYFYHYYKSKNIFLKKFWPGRTARIVSRLMVGGILFRYFAWSLLDLLGIRRGKAGLMRRAIEGVMKRRREVFLF